VLDGDPVDDRSATMATVLKELLGWANWLNKHGLTSSSSALTIAHDAFYSIYSYPHDLDGKFDRILNSIKDPEAVLPAIALASENGEATCWKKVCSQNYELYDKLAPEEDKKALQKTKASPKNSILSFESFDLETKSKSTTKPKESMPTPETPTQLINLQENGSGQNRQFSENDVADIIVSNQGKDFIYDSNTDQFFTYDNDQGIWYVQDEQHIKRRIVKALDSLVQAGVMPKYNAANVNSRFSNPQSKAS